MSTRAEPDSVDIARRRMCAEVSLLDAETVSLEAAGNRVLAAAIYAMRDQPPFRSAAMDGYALRKADLEKAQGLRVVGVSAAGARYPHHLLAGQAVRIFTGAAVPDGADCVVPQEDVVLDHGGLHACRPRQDHIRDRAVDFSVGTRLIPPGTRLDSFDLSLLAAAGQSRVEVVRRPRIALLATGSELVAPGMPAAPDQVYESLSFGIGALISGWGGVPIRLAPQLDSVDTICRAAEKALPEADLLVTLGGASVGDHDLVKPALACLHLETIVPRIAVKPGKPTWFGRTSVGRVLGLPGNPVAALVCAHLFLQPMIDRMLGRNPDSASRRVRARTRDPLGPNCSVEHYIRARIDTDHQGCLMVSAIAQQDTSVLSALTNVNALILRPVDAPAVAAGELVDVINLDRR